MISVIAPSRGRPERLQQSIDSLALTSADPTSYEVIVALDEDDADNYWAITGCRFLVIPDRPGYRNLHVYFNALADEASGEWHFGWNDDATMQTEGWDARINEHEPDYLLSAIDHYHGRGMPTFPIWPAQWVKILGHVSLSCAIDSWMLEVASRLGRMQDVDITVYHDRPATTGRADDPTWRERAGATHQEWADMLPLRLEDVETLRAAL